MSVEVVDEFAGGFGWVVPELMRRARTRSYTKVACGSSIPSRRPSSKAACAPSASRRV